MAGLSKTIIRTGLETLYFSGTHHLARPFLGGVGAILTFHHVRPARPDAFQPNRLLEITPTFLDDLLTRVRAAGFDIVSLDEAHRRLAERDHGRRFVALTFDDGYRDNRDHALPVLRRHKAPFTLFVPSSFAEGSGDLWWLALERAIAARDWLEVAIGGDTLALPSSTPAQKAEAYSALYWRLRRLGSEAEMRAVIRDFALTSGVDVDRLCPGQCMGWDELAIMAEDPLVTIGAHTATHIMLAKAPESVVRVEMELGAARIARALGRRPEHFSFPVGDPSSAGPREFAIARELGFRTAVTTRPGVLFPEHADHLTALPRISVNGEFQRLRYLEVLLSGAPTALLNRFRRIDAA